MTAQIELITHQNKFMLYQLHIRLIEHLLNQGAF